MRTLIIACLLLSLALNLYALPAERDADLAPAPTMTKSDAKEMMGIGSLLLGGALIFGATKATYDNGQGFLFSFGGVCILHGTICLVKF